MSRYSNSVFHDSPVRPEYGEATDELPSLGVAGSTTWLRIAMIHSCCNSSTADHRLFGSRSKHLFRKSMPWGLS